VTLKFTDLKKTKHICLCTQTLKSTFNAYNPSTWKTEAGGFQVQGQPGQDPVSKKNKTNEKPHLFTIIIFYDKNTQHQIYLLEQFLSL
jgi:hypothetical protein